MINIYVLFIGISTSSSAVYSFLALCVVKPDLQTRLQTEIYEQIGERLPTLSDRSKLPFVEAAILELFRYVSHVPIAVPHKTTREIDLGGFRLQRGIPVSTNTYISFFRRCILRSIKSNLIALGSLYNWFASPGLLSICTLCIGPESPHPQTFKTTTSIHLISFLGFS